MPTLPAHRRRPRFSARPFFVSTAALLALIVIHRVLPDHARAQPIRARGLDPTLNSTFDTLSSNPFGALDDVPCALVYEAADQCAFVRTYCEDEEAGLLPYLSFYYCTLSYAQPVAFAILVAWLGLLFTTIGIAASDFFSVNLGTISRLLGLSESLAGVTFLAFGNGSPDVFSTFAAMGSNSGSMAVGELIGAASFITAVVAGSMALVREFPVSPRTFVRDICFFIVSIIFAMGFLADGKIWLWECCAMIGFYAFYVVTVVSWHWIVQRRKRRRVREALLRSEYYGTVTAGLSSSARATAAVDELAPYHDDEYGHVTSADGTADAPGPNAEPDGSATLGHHGRHNAPPDISALERGPRIEISSVVANPATTGEIIRTADCAVIADDEEEERNRHISAEMTSSMRVNRPRGRRSTTVITPIRPSLLGALEFRSVLSSLQRSGSVHMTPLGRRQSTTTIPGPRFSDYPEYTEYPFGELPATAVEYGSTGSPRAPRDTNRLQVEANNTRGRALSSGDAPRNLHDIPMIRTEPVVPETVGENGYQADAAHDYDVSPLALPGPSVPDLHLHIPTFEPQRQSSPRSSPSLSPFPTFAESPSPRSIAPLASSSRTSSFGRSPNDILSGVNAHDSDSSRQDEQQRQQQPKPVRWWPYSVLPPPHVIACTLFPTVQGWREKSIWDKFVSLVSMPTVFLLVTTLPVVEEYDEDDEEDVVALEQDEEAAAQDIDTEWQRYLQSRPTTGMEPGEPEQPEQSGQSSHPEESEMSAETLNDHVIKKQARRLPTSGTSSETDIPNEWNRWLAVLQLFTGPLFTAFIVWANQDPPRSGRALLRAVLCALVASLVMLAVLLGTTTAARRPRYHSLLCFLGFVISVAWISTVAGEVVGVLKTFGVIVGISEAILGLTIFAVGNSLGDLVADITVARLGYPVMALSACFGGPMLNILLGVGIGGLWMTTRGGNDATNNGYYEIEVGSTLMISAITVLGTLLTLLVAVPVNGWIMSRRIGVVLICMWTFSTFMNVVVEVTS